MMKYDCLVVGGGVVGLHLVCMLAKVLGKGASIALAAREDPPLAVPRLYTLTPGTVSTLTELGLAPLNATSFSAMDVEDLVSGASFHYRAQDFSLDELGITVEETDLISSSSKVVTQLPNVDVIQPLASIGKDGDSWLCCLEDGSECEAQYVFAADGARSQVARAAGLEIKPYPCGDTAIVAQLESSDNDACASARQWFTHEGIVALLPDKNNSLSLVWSIESRKAKIIMDMSGAQFEQALQRAIAGQAGEITLLSERSSFPVFPSMATGLYRNKVALFGNSACTIHPLAGQGLNLAMLQLSNLWQSLKEYGLNERSLYQFQAEALPVNHSYMLVMNTIRGMFRSTNLLNVLARNLVIRQAAQRRLISSLIVDCASGYSFGRFREVK